MRYSEKPAGMTLAEALGIIVPDDAPGGQALGVVAGSQRSTHTHGENADAEYQGFHDVDGFAKAPRSE